MPKLKELSVINNPIQDNRLKKLISQKPTKTVLDYVRQGYVNGALIECALS